MTIPRLLAAAMTLAFLGLGLGCGPSEPEDASADSEVKETYAAPGRDLGKATHVIADVVGDAAFVVFDRTLERRDASGKVEAIAKIDAGFESLVVSKKRIAWVTSAIVSNKTRVLLHLLDRDSSQEILKEDLSTEPSIYRHPLAFLDDETLAVGHGEEVLVYDAAGAKTKLAGYASKFRADRVDALYPTATADTFYALLDNEELYAVDVKTNTVSLQPKLERPDRFTRIASFDPKSNAWLTYDFDGIRIYGTDGKKLREVNLVTAKRRMISNVTRLADGRILVANESEKSQERSVLAAYDFATLGRTEIGTFEGSIRNLAPTAKKLFYAFSPSGAEGFNSRVWYAYARELE